MSIGKNRESDYIREKTREQESMKSRCLQPLQGVQQEGGSMRLPSLRSQDLWNKATDCEGFDT